MRRAIYAIQQDLKRGLSVKIILAVVGVAFCVLLDNADVIKYIGEEGGPSVFYFLFFSISYGGLFGRYLLPVMSALPAGTMFVEDYEHHFF